MRPAVVLEAGEHPPTARVELDLDRDVADQPRPVGADRAQIDQPDPGQRLVAELVGVSEQLIATADREDHRAAVGRRVQRVALELGQVEGAQLLVAVLAAADVVEVGAVGVERLAEAGSRSARTRSRATGSAARA